jgi:ribonuclease HII
VTAVPTLRVERQLLPDGAAVVCGVDEVGRGALGGPVTVGMVAIDATVSRSPAGVRDSKLLSPGAREALEPRIRRWARAHAVGHATAAEIDEVGIIAALRRAGLRAWAQLPVPVDVILLDGSHDWLTPPEQGSLFDDDPADPPAPGLPSVVTRVKADLTCTTVAAASVLAKTERDRVMVTLAGEHPGYGWEQNKGYASPEHLAALAHHGPCPQHRRSWRLPGGSAG